MSPSRYVFEQPFPGRNDSALWWGRDTLDTNGVGGTRVVLKAITSVGDAVEERARRQVAIATTFDHPHLVKVLDLVEGEGRTWLVMEFIDGGSLLEKVARSGALPEDEAARLVGEMADGLAQMHRQRVVHRDVKPSNVLLRTGADGVQHAMLTDYAIARGVDDAVLTKTGLVTGTPAYLAPELVTGSSADEASDVWALGATLYHLVTGSAPYDDSDPLATMYRIIDEPEPRAGWSGQVRTALEHSLVKDPQQRWSAEQLSAYLLGEAPAPNAQGSSAAPESSTSALNLWDDLVERFGLRTLQIGIAVLGVVVLVLLLLLT